MDLAEHVYIASLEEAGGYCSSVHLVVSCFLVSCLIIWEASLFIYFSISVVPFAASYISVDQGH